MRNWSAECHAFSLCACKKLPRRNVCSSSERATASDWTLLSRTRHRANRWSLYNKKHHSYQVRELYSNRYLQNLKMERSFAVVPLLIVALAVFVQPMWAAESWIDILSGEHFDDIVGTTDGSKLFTIPTVLMLYKPSCAPNVSKTKTSLGNLETISIAPRFNKK